MVIGVPRWLYRVYPPRMATDMRKTPSYLKGLAENRARISGEISRLQQLLDEIDPHLAKAQRLQAIHAATVARLVAAQAERDACDLLIRKFDGRLNPEEIAPIRAFKGRYGKRGQLRDTVIELLRHAAPAEVSTLDLRVLVIAELQLDFPTAEALAKWSSNSLVNTLKDLVEEGVVERLHDLVARPGTVGRWRLKECGPGGLDKLGAAAEASGVGVSQAKRRGRPRKSEQSVTPL